MPEDRTSLSRPGGIGSSARLTAGAAADPVRLQATVEAFAVLGVALCVVAIIIGLRMALHATVVPCADGTTFPAGTTDFRCFAHRHAGDGAVIAIFAVVLGILLGFGSLAVTLHLRRQGHGQNAAGYKTPLDRSAKKDARS